MQLLLVGNYGVRNAGDEILREYFLKRYPEHQWIVCSAHPKEGELPRLPAGMRSFFSWQWIRTLRALRRADGMVFGGGSLFTDVESAHACVIWWIHAMCAVLCRKPLFLAFQGIGPFRSRCAQWCAQWVVARARFISVRDWCSYERVKGWQMNTKVVQSFDPAILLLTQPQTSESSAVIFIPRTNTNNSMRPSMCTHEVQLHHMNEREGLHAIFERLSNARCIVTERYHGAIAALAFGIPFIALAQRTGDKLDALSKACGYPCIERTQLPCPVPQLIAKRLPFDALALRGEQALRQALR